MIYKLESLDRIIDKIIRDLGISQSEIPYADFIEWIADGLQHIGSYYQYQEKEGTVLIENFTGLLPCDVYKVIRITEGTTLTDLGGGLYSNSMSGILARLGVDFSLLTDYEKSILAGSGLEKIGFNYGNVVSRLQHNKSLIGDVAINSFTNRDYNINFDRITTAYNCGIIKVQYLALPIDERGWPLVPDDVSFRDALFWKVAYQLSMRAPESLPNKALQNLDYCKSKWNYYCTQARASANMPDLSMTERIANNWSKLFNPVDLDSQYYRELGKKQNLNLNGRY